MKKTTATLTVQEKIRLLTGKDFWHTDDLDGKIPNITMSDGPVGLRTERTGEDGKTFTIPAVAYPSIQALANTWNPECARVMGECLADDCRDRGVELLLAPGVNIKRHPLNGRNFEYFSEDPQLAGTLAKAYVEGVQDSGIGVCLKHFCCNNLEYDRLHQTSDVDERTLRELYYRPFEIVCEAKPVSVMCSYNRINGEYAAEYRKGFDFLRDECGFDGAVVSDWGAVRDRTASVKAGLDLEMPHGEAGMEKLARDLQEGSVTEGELDVCVGRVLQLVQRLKEMGKGKENKRTEAERAAAARGIAEESIVLLKNNGVLPLKKDALLSVSGIYAKPDQTDYLSGGGSAAVRWLENTADLPAAGTFRSAGVTRYQEGLDVGYRYFDTYDVPVLYPFGHGLSYSEFFYRDLRLSLEDGRVIAEYVVENVSGRDGKEVSQVYVGEDVPLVYRPKKELKGFSKDLIKAGKCVKVRVGLDFRAFAHWNAARDTWTVTDGVYTVSVGASAEDIRLTAKLRVEDGKFVL